jgi:phosphomethylpyrimidine synthase
MVTQLESAREGKVTAQLAACAKAEGLNAELLRERVAAGHVVIEAPPGHEGIRPLAIGAGTRIKVNANIGTSPDRADVKVELEKLHAALEAGADTIMDLSTGGELDAIRKTLIENCSVPVGTVPIYQAVRETIDRGKAIVELSPEHLFTVIEKHGEDGVSFVTVHCGVTIASLERLKKQKRVLGIVSRGGAFLCRWIEHNKKENPLYEHYDRLLEIAHKYDMTLSLGDGLRPGCIADATDRAQVEELIVLGELTRRAQDAGVQVMIEGPGHVPLDQIEANVKLQKSLTDGAPFYVLGPLVTDIAPGFDHITGAIGGALAAWAGADFLCYVTPSEHLGLPAVEDVRRGVIASMIAAHAADIARGTPGAAERDLQMSIARAQLDWKKQKECALSSRPFEKYRESSPPQDSDVCTMCGEFCAIKVSRKDSES